MIEPIDPRNVDHIADHIDRANGRDQDTAAFRATLIRRAEAIAKFSTKTFS